MKMFTYFALLASILVRLNLFMRRAQVAMSESKVSMLVTGNNVLIMANARKKQTDTKSTGLTL
ncbi:MAG: hypothetical protein ABGW96_06715 [Methylophilaceae bacterium]